MNIKETLCYQTILPTSPNGLNRIKATDFCNTPPAPHTFPPFPALARRVHLQHTMAREERPLLCLQDLQAPVEAQDPLRAATGSAWVRSVRKGGRQLEVARGS